MKKTAIIFNIYTYIFRSILPLVDRPAGFKVEAENKELGNIDFF